MLFYFLPFFGNSQTHHILYVRHEILLVIKVNTHFEHIYYTFCTLNKHTISSKPTHSYNLTEVKVRGNEEQVEEEERFERSTFRLNHIKRERKQMKEERKEIHRRRHKMKRQTSFSVCSSLKKYVCSGIVV